MSWELVQDLWSRGIGWARTVPCSNYCDWTGRTAIEWVECTAALVAVAGSLVAALALRYAALGSDGECERALYPRQSSPPSRPQAY